MLKRHIIIPMNEGSGHVVWFDDARSMNAKLRMIAELQLEERVYGRCGFLSCALYGNKRIVHH